MEYLAARLIPYRKWMLVIFLITIVVAMPAAVALMILFKNPIFFVLGSFVSVLGFTWPWGTFLISYWYNPDGGPLTRDKIKTTHPLLRWHAYLMRCYAPVFLVIWFLSPVIVFAMQIPFIKIMMEK